MQGTGDGRAGTASYSLDVAGARLCAARAADAARGRVLRRVRCEVPRAGPSADTGASAAGTSAGHTRRIRRCHVLCRRGARACARYHSVSSVPALRPDK
jgi:hypothetical protein